MGGLHLHSSHGQNHDDSSLLLTTHLQGPDQKDRQDGIDQVADACDCRISISSTDDNRSIQARSRTTGQACPEVLRRRALEDKQKEKEQAVDFCDDCCDPEDDLVCRSYAETIQHDGDAGFDRHV